MSWDANTYDSAAVPQQIAGEELIRLLKIKDGDNVLDLGCGPGTLTAQLAMLTPSGNVFGIDSSQSMIEKARRKTEAMGLTNTHFLLADIMELNYESHFDVIFLNSVATWVSEQQKLFSMIRTALKANGNVGAQTASAGGFDSEFMFDVLPKVLQLQKFSDAITCSISQGWTPPSGGRLLSTDHFENLFAETGFSKSEIVTKEFVFFAKNTKEVISSMRPAVDAVFSEVLTGGLVTEFWDEVEKGVELHLGKTSDFEITRKRVFALGTKI